MRIAVVSCNAYRDAWKPFFVLLRKFWPNCPYEVVLLVDGEPVNPGSIQYGGAGPDTLYVRSSQSWSHLVGCFASENSQPILLLQEDFLFSHPVQPQLVRLALENLKRPGIGAVRLMPCPGSDMEEGDKHFGMVSRDMLYRTSCQATIWDPRYLQDIADNAGGPRACDFEMDGAKHAREVLKPEVMAARRDVYPWAIQYVVTAIVRGKWIPEAKTLCDEHGIEVDWSRGIKVPA